MNKPLSKYSNLTQRIITGLLGSALIIYGLIVSEWAYFAIFFIICFFSLREFYKLSAFDGLLPLKTVGIVIGMVVFCLSFFIERGDFDPKYYFVIFPLMALVYMIKLYKKGEHKPFTNIAFTFLGVFYIGVPISLLNHAVFVPTQAEWHSALSGYNFEPILGILLILWATDTGAYFAGTFFGKHKLFERISPKKTWEGFVGGAVLAGVIAFVFSLILRNNGLHYLSTIDWIVITIIIVVGGTFGDLVESLLKRSIEIKDSGTAIPGHGGFLDRFDGLFISAPFVVAYLEIFKGGF
ncbi:MAG: CDP-archaeol synthase [Cyclobacteriaceae bacterium]